MGRDGARRWVGVGVLLCGVVAACGSGAERVGSGGSVGLAALDSVPRSAPEADPGMAGDAIDAFGQDLFGAVAVAADPDANVVVSPASVAIALAMLEPGATGEGQARLRALLGIDDPVAFHASMNALEQSLEGRVAQAANEGEDPGEIMVRIANAAYLQQGYPFLSAYLDTVGTHYGAVLHEVDFASDPDAVADEINRFVAEATNDRITDVVADGALDPDTVLALVNALYLKASWQEVFDEDATEDATFTSLDGAEQTLPLMHGTSNSSARGDGWVAATKDYVGGLSAHFILPDDGRFEEVAADLGAVSAALEENQVGGGELALPRFEVRFDAEISDALRALGLGALYQRGSLLGIADDPRLMIDTAIHETFVAMDEEGAEAAAATVIGVMPTSGGIEAPVPVILDRPFLVRIVDDQTGSTLFLGRILDPSVSPGG